MDAQASLFDYPNAPGFKARATSEAAAHAVAPMAMGLRARVFEALKVQADTPEGIARRLGLDILTVRPRFSELSAKGLIEDSGRRGPARAVAGRQRGDHLEGGDVIERDLIHVGARLELIRRTSRFPSHTIGPHAETIVASVAERLGVTVKELKSQDRSRRVAHPRQEAMFELYLTGRYSMPTIGAYFGGRDHTTVIHGIRAHKRRAGIA